MNKVIENILRPVAMKITVFASLIVALSACTHPHKVDIALEASAPQAKITTFGNAVRDLGLMSQIYGTQKLHIMARDIVDNTGSSIATSAEIPRDITEMLKSTLNGFGGNVVYIPYDPEFIINSANTGYSGFNTKLQPNVVVSGGITEFDRGLETRGKNTDLSLEEEIQGRDLGFDFSKQAKDSTASITLDFNLIDFESLAGISRMQAINNIKVHKALAEDNLAFSISGNSIGFRGNVKKVQGRHAAVRMLVQLSMVQVIGKYLKLPYWNLLPNVPPDPVVIDQVVADFYAMDERARVLAVQEMLVLNGYPVALTSQLSDDTQQALAKFSEMHPGASGSIDKDTFLALYTSVPVSQETLHKRALLADLKTQAALRNSALSMDGRLRISSNGTEFAIGDEIKLFFEVTVPMYVRVFNISSSGEVSLLFPSDERADVMLRPGTNYEIPSPEASYALKVTGPTGEDRILALASPTRFPNQLPIVDGAGKLNKQMKTTVPTTVDMNIVITDGHQNQALR